MKDVYIADGTVAIQGGYFEDNQTAAADGYVYKDNVQTVDGITYNYEVWWLNNTFNPQEPDRSCGYKGKDEASSFNNIFLQTAELQLLRDLLERGG